MAILLPDCVQAREFAEAAGRTTCSGYEVAPISAAALAALAPGMCPAALAAAAQGDGRGAGLLVQGGLVVHPERYVRCDLRFTILVSWAWRLGLPVAPEVWGNARQHRFVGASTGLAMHTADTQLIRAGLHVLMHTHTALWCGRSEWAQAPAPTGVWGGLPPASDRYKCSQPKILYRALWEACRLRAMDVGGGCSAEIVRENVTSLAQLEADAGPFDAVVVAAGAAVGAVPELREPCSTSTHSTG